LLVCAYSSRSAFYLQHSRALSFLARVVVAAILRTSTNYQKTKGINRAVSIEPDFEAFEQNTPASPASAQPLKEHLQGIVERVTYLVNWLNVRRKMSVGRSGVEHSGQKKLR
jgi:hypothetical protein